MNLGLASWAAGGVTIGVLHAFSLWRHAQPPFRWAAAGSLRVLGVGGLLLVSGLLGGLVPAAVGWACGFPVTVAILYFLRDA